MPIKIGIRPDVKNGGVFPPRAALIGSALASVAVWAIVGVGVNQYLRDRIGFKRANVAVARKLAVVLHAMWRSGRPFEAEGRATG